MKKKEADSIYAPSSRHSFYFVSTEWAQTPKLVRKHSKMGPMEEENLTLFYQINAEIKSIISLQFQEKHNGLFIFHRHNH